MLYLLSLCGFFQKLKLVSFIPMLISHCGLRNLGNDEMSGYTKGQTKDECIERNNHFGFVLTVWLKTVIEKKRLYMFGLLVG